MITTQGLGDDIKKLPKKNYEVIKNYIKQAKKHLTNDYVTNATLNGIHNTIIDYTSNRTLANQERMIAIPTYCWYLLDGIHLKSNILVPSSRRPGMFVGADKGVKAQKFEHKIHNLINRLDNDTLYSFMPETSSCHKATKDEMLEYLDKLIKK